MKKKYLTDNKKKILFDREYKMINWLLNKFRHKKIIIIAPRWSNIWAGLVSQKRIYGEGKSVPEALGNLVLHHQKEFGINITSAFGDEPEIPLGESYITITEQEYNTLINIAGWSKK